LAHVRDDSRLYVETRKEKTVVLQEGFARFAMSTKNSTHSHHQLDDRRSNRYCPGLGGTRSRGRPFVRFEIGKLFALLAVWEWRWAKIWQVAAALSSRPNKRNRSARGGVSLSNQGWKNGQRNRGN